MATFADSLVSEMAQNFNEALDGVDPIDLSDDKTRKWRGLLNNRYAAASVRRSKKSSIEGTGDKDAIPPECGDVAAAAASGSTTPTTPVVDDKVNNTAAVSGVATDKEPVVTAMGDGTDEAALDADKPKRVLRRKTMTTPNPISADKKTPVKKGNKAMVVKDNHKLEAEEVSEESEPLVPRRKGRAKRVSDSQDNSQFEPKTLRTRRSDRQQSLLQQTPTTDSTTRNTKDEEDVDVDLPKLELPANNEPNVNVTATATKEDSPEVIQVPDDEGEESKPSDVRNDETRLTVVEFKKQRQSSDEEDSKNVNSFVLTVLNDELACKTEEDVVEVKDEQPESATPVEKG